MCVCSCPEAQRGSRSGPDMEKDNFCFTQTRFKPIIFYPKKCANYNNSYLRQNSVNGPKYLNSAKKMPKKDIKF